MADVIQRVAYYHVDVPDRPGEGARVLTALRDAGADLAALHTFPRADGAQLDFVPLDEQAFVEAARQADLDLSTRKTAFLVRGDDRPGAAADLLARVGSAGINVTALDAIAVDGRYGALFWVADDDVARAVEVLGAIDR